MKRLIHWPLAVLLSIGMFTALPAFSQNLGLIPGKAKTAAAGLVINYENGKSVITYQGAKVFEGATKAKAMGVVKNVSGVQYAAAFDGSKVVWENVKGAAAKVK